MTQPDTCALFGDAQTITLHIQRPNMMAPISFVIPRAPEPFSAQDAEHLRHVWAAILDTARAAYPLLLTDKHLPYATRVTGHLLAARDAAAARAKMR